MVKITINLSALNATVPISPQAQGKDQVRRVGVAEIVSIF
jgi:hypothetical protein